MNVTDEIKTKLTAAFDIKQLEIRDDSEQHRGHAGYQEGGESHFTVRIQSPAFTTMSRIERHRAVHAAIGPDLISRIHALALNISD